MTPEEAIKILRGTWALILQTHIRFEDIENYRLASAFAIKAIEKQIPKKVNTKPDTYSYCPECDSVLASTYYKAKYCHCCGQRIKWE